MARASKPDHFVVDGSNIATEGRSAPSLEQLNEAVLAFMDDHPGAIVTVVVDATFGHRIATKEVKAFDEAVANNELVTPPAGAVGRGDAFLLTIADKAGAGVLSNDSFQEFHGEYDWLFDEGRLIGGKPVPHVGWVFVARTPVRGPKSRRSVREAKDVDRQEAKQVANRRVRAKSTPSESSDAGRAEPVGVAPDESDVPQQQPEQSTPRRRGGRKQGAERVAERAVEAPVEAPAEAQSASPPSRDHVNDLMPFLDFVERHPVGTSCTAVVETYASHGAYARSGDALIYLPLRLLDDPAPRSARSVLDIGESVTVVVVGFTPDRRSIDAAMPHMAADLVKAASAHQPAPSPRRVAPGSTRARPSTAKPSPEQPAATKKVAATRPAAKSAGAKTVAAKTSTATKAAATKAAPTSDGETTPTLRKPRQQAAEHVATIEASKPTKRAATTRAATKQPSAKQPSPKQPSTKQAATKQAAGKQAAEQPSAKQAATKQAATKQAPGKQAPGKQATKQAATKQAPGKQATKQAAGKQAAGKQAAKQPSAKQPSAKQAATKQAATKQAPGKQAPGKQATKQAAGKQAAGKQAAGKQASSDASAGTAAPPRTTATRKTAARKTAVTTPRAAKAGARTAPAERSTAGRRATS